MGSCKIQCTLFLKQARNTSGFYVAFCGVMPELDNSFLGSWSTQHFRPSAVGWVIVD